MPKRKIPDRKRKRFAGQPGFGQIVAETVRAARRDRQLRQDEVADVAGVSLSFVRDLEAGKPSLRLDRLLEVLDVLGMGLEIVAARRTEAEADADG